MMKDNIFLNPEELALNPKKEYLTEKQYGDVEGRS